MRAASILACGLCCLLGVAAFAPAPATSTGAHADSDTDTDSDLRAAFAAHLAERERAFLRVPLLSAREKQLMRASRNDCHVAAARRLGIPHDAGFSESEQAAAETELVCLDPDSPYYVEHSCQARLTPDARRSLDLVGDRFHRALAVAGLPPARFAVSSAYRSPAYQRRLRRLNRNAARTTSSHEFGTTYDITYRRFFGAPAPGTAAAASSAPRAVDFHRFRPGARTHGPLDPCLAEELAAAERAWAARMTERYASRYAAVLGRCLIALEGEGALLVLREWRQPCYHVTVARELTGA